MTRQEMEDTIRSLERQIGKLRKERSGRTVWLPGDEPEYLRLRDPKETGKVAFLSLDLSNRASPATRIEVQ